MEFRTEFGWPFNSDAVLGFKLTPVQNEFVAEPRALLDLQDRLTPYAQTAPTEEEVAPWIERILELWQDEKQARELRDRLAMNAKRFRLEVCARRTREFFW